MIHTHDSLRSQDGDFENFHYQLDDGEQYRLTDAELGWLKFVSGRYAIADHVRDNLVDDVYTVDLEGMSQALDDDGMSYKAVCLSDDTVLQSIFFYSAYEVAA
jgi:hypothetical protein